MTNKFRISEKNEEWILQYQRGLGIYAEKVVR